MNRLSCLALATLALAACATPRVAAPTAVTPAARSTQSEAHDALFALFKASGEAALRLNPLEALFRGDLRYADRFGDLISDRRP